MSGYQRQHVTIVLTRLAEPPERLIVVSGPRQTGKTTLVRQALDKIDMGGHYLSIDEPQSPEPSLSFDNIEQVTSLTAERNAQWLIHAWEKARRNADNSERGFVLVLDEIQKIPQWSETVKGLWDADRAAERSGRNEARATVGRSLAVSAFPLYVPV